MTFFLSFFVLTGSSLITNNSFQENILLAFRNKNIKESFDMRLENIEKGIKLQDKKLICTESKQALGIITDNINSLKRIEPYYNWEEIRKAIQNKAIKHCQISHSNTFLNSGQSYSRI